MQKAIERWPFALCTWQMRDIYAVKGLKMTSGPKMSSGIWMDEIYLTFIIPMKKRIVLLLLILFPLSLWCQGWVAPDSARNIPRPGSSGAYGITNPLNHNGTQFGNTPITMSCIMNCTADDIYFYDLGMNIPSTVSITGIELIHSRGACNSGSFMVDTLFLAYNGVPIGTFKRDTSSMSETDTLGGNADLWGAVLTPAILNDPSFGIIVRSTGSGICTYAQWNLQMRVHFNCVAGQDTGRIPDSVALVARPGSTGAYSIQNPLTHNGNQFTNAPTTVSCAINCKADHLYFQDLDFAIPANAQITGVQVRKTSGACNSGSVMTDTLQLAYNGAVLGSVKWDSSGVFYSVTFGNANDTWGAALTPAIVNSPTFGVWVTSTSTGICTYMQTDLRMDVFYCIPSTPSSRDALTSYTELQLFPNPAQKRVTILNGAESQSFTIWDVNGKAVQSGQLREGENILELTGLVSGVYLITTQGSAVRTARLVVE